MIKLTLVPDHDRPPPYQPQVLSKLRIELKAALPDVSAERFIVNPQLKRYLMTFSQGSRQCLGMQLAYTELFLMHSGIRRRFGGKEDHGEDGWWELVETDRSDTGMACDRFAPYPEADSKGIRIKACK